ncbi:MAG: deoxyguanosinetriphosphate triphosphohydrolase [Cyclobacteriaceae bacterium]|nr:deoxyguanosinetriphosphate triphosphohydrolase [Cyclobacteriaceae bacterium]
MNWSSLLSAQRLGQTPSTAEGSRSAFEQDYDRIIFSHPFRRLQDKTQVHPLPEDDFVHTRLTHSLEVSSVGRSLGKRVAETVLQRHPELARQFSLFDFGAIVAAASLAHDLGNPPFGHAGEDALSDYFRKRPEARQDLTDEQWADLLSFEGNAQGFRILNQASYGLRLTLATLGAFTKYPCPSHFQGRDATRKSQKKFGFFDTERESFEAVAGALQLSSPASGAWHRHPLAFLVEAADDICYSIIDLEDGCNLGLISFEETVELLAPILGEKLHRGKLGRDESLNKKLGTLRALAIGELIEACTGVFLDEERGILEGTFDGALTDRSRFRESLREISKHSVERIYRARHVVEIEAAGHEVLPGLLEEFLAAAFAHQKGEKSRKYQNLALLLPPEVRHAVRETSSRYVLIRSVIDFVSGMTDKHALNLYRKIKGMSL